MGWLERIFGNKRREARRALEAQVRAILEADGPSVAWRALAGALAREREPVELFHLAAHVLRIGNEPQLAELFDRAADAPHDPQRLFELGSELLVAEEGEAAAAILERALAFAPFDAVVRSELALAQARSGRPDRVVATLALHPCLGDDPGALFQFGWASLLTGDLEAAEGALAELRAAPPLRAMLESAIERARLGMASDPPDARDWLFVEHGALLLDAGGELGGRYDALDLDAERAGAMISELAWLLPELVPGPRRVVAIDEEHGALAESVARACGGSVIAPSGKGRLPAAIVPLWRADGVSALSREDLDASEMVFVALTMDFARTLPRTPDIVGALARRVVVHGSIGAANGEGDRAFREYVRVRGAWLPPHAVRVRTAYVPDAPLPA